MDFQGIAQAIVDAKSGVRTSLTVTQEELNRLQILKNQKDAETAIASWRTYNKIYPGLEFIRATLGKLWWRREDLAEGKMCVTVGTDAEPRLSRYSLERLSWRGASIHLAGRKVSARQKQIIGGSLKSSDFTNLKVNLEQEPAGLDRIIQHVAVIIVEGPNPPNHIANGRKNSQLIA